MLNARGKNLPNAYYLANLVKTQACLDKEKSDFDMSELDTTQARQIRKLILNNDKIDENCKIFRLAEMNNLHIVTKELAIDIKRNHSCEGPLFLHSDDYGKEFRKG